MKTHTEAIKKGCKDCNSFSKEEATILVFLKLHPKFSFDLKRIIHETGLVNLQSKINKLMIKGILGRAWVKNRYEYYLMSEWNNKEEVCVLCSICQAQLKEAERHDRIMQKIKEEMWKINVKTASQRNRLPSIILVEVEELINKIDQEEEK